MPNGELESGLRKLAELPEVMPEDAEPETRQVYDDVQATLRVPIVNLLFRALANYPDFLVPAWRATAPMLAARQAEAVADELRARALVEPIAATGDLDAAASAAGEPVRIRAFTDTIHYVLPKLLLVATAFHEGGDLAATRPPDEAAEADAHTGDLPRAVATGTVSVPLVDPDAGEVSDLLESIRSRHEHPGVASYFRGLANWPEFLEAAWRALEEFVGSEPYRERRDELPLEARRGIGRLAATGVGGRLPDPDPESASVLAAFRYRLIPDLMLDLGRLKAMLDGLDAARSSRFSATASTGGSPQGRE